jgi:hypothetical protein
MLDLKEKLRKKLRGFKKQKNYFKKKKKFIYFMKK